MVTNNYQIIRVKKSVLHYFRRHLANSDLPWPDARSLTFAYNFTCSYCRRCSIPLRTLWAITVSSLGFGWKVWPKNSNISIVTFDLTVTWCYIILTQSGMHLFRPNDRLPSPPCASRGGHWFGRYEGVRFIPQHRAFRCIPQRRAG